jgi:hypothetical protein
MKDNNPFEQMFGSYLGKDDEHGYHCTKCDYEMEMIVVKTTLESPKKLFYCKRNKCERFGIVTVVAKVKNKK